MFIFLHAQYSSMGTGLRRALEPGCIVNYNNPAPSKSNACLEDPNDADEKTKFGKSEQSRMAVSMKTDDRVHDRPRRVNAKMAKNEPLENRSKWTGLELTGPIKNLSPELWKFDHLTVLLIKNNNLQRIPSDISRLCSLLHLDLSGNKLRSLPVELGDMIHLRELYLDNNAIRILPCELGRLFLLQQLGISGNPLSHDILSMSIEPHGTSKLLTFLLDNLAGTFVCFLITCMFLTH